MLFSVCIPVYNTAKYLDECLASVLCQTEQDYEIVLVNDGSTDESGAICDSYAARYPQVRVIHKENEGLMMTRRRGFLEAKGDYFVCLDSDDALCDADALKKLRHMIEAKGADLVIYEYIYGTELRAKAPDRHIRLFDLPDGHLFCGQDKQLLYRKLLLEKFFNPIVIKAASRRIVDLDTDYSRWKDSLVRSQGEDLLQSLPILDKAQRIVYLKAPLYFYRFNPQSISKNVRPDYYFAYRTIYERTDLYLEKWDFTPEEVHRIRQGRLNMLFGVLLAEHPTDKAAWRRVIRQVADDPFFHALWQHRDKASVCLYYRCMGYLLLKKRFGLLQLGKRATEILRKIMRRA